MTSDQHLIFEAYKTKQATLQEMNLGPGAEGEGLGAPIITKLHSEDDLQQDQCTCGSPDCAECNAEDCNQEFTALAKQQLFRIHRISEDLHELIDHHAFKPWMASKITTALADLAQIYDRVDYEASVSTEVDVPEEFTDSI